jgi:hypothetical protein
MTLAGSLLRQHLPSSLPEGECCAVGSLMGRESAQLQPCNGRLHFRHVDVKLREVSSHSALGQVGQRTGSDHEGPVACSRQHQLCPAASRTTAGAAFESTARRRSCAAAKGHSHEFVLDSATRRRAPFWGEAASPPEEGPHEASSASASLVVRSACRGTGSDTFVALPPVTLRPLLREVRVPMSGLTNSARRFLGYGGWSLRGQWFRDGGGSPELIQF